MCSSDLWKLIRLYQANDDLTDRHELYNLRDDIGETRDLAAAEPGRVGAMGAKLDGFLADTRAVLPRPNPAYDPALNVEIAGWRPIHDAGMRAAPGHVVILSRGSDPQIATVFEPPVTGPLKVEVRMKSPSRGDGAVYWTHGSQGYAKQRGTFFKPVHDGQWHDYTLDLPAAGKVSGLRLDPSSGPGEILVERIRLLFPDGAELKAWSFAAP